MNVKIFLENFGYIANAPDGVKRLREMILHYAVSGKLVAQINSDGNVEQDIKMANFLKEKFQQSFKIRSRKPIELLRNEEIPFSIPTNWKWTRMESIACYIQRGKGPMYAESGQSLVVSQKCIQWLGFDLTPARRISDESLRQYGEERFLIKGDILWNSTGTGTAGRVAIYPGSQVPVVADSHVTIIRLTNFVPQYVWCYLASPVIQAKMVPNQEGSMVSGTTNQVELSMNKVMELPVPCPPLKEQKRIVAKVDELMALCDKLEVQQQELERRFSILSRACHARFVEAPTLVNLKAIFDEAGSVSTEDLRKTILSLAVQGKLVSQDTRDGTGEELLDRIKKVGKRKEYSSVRSSDAFFEAPKSWSWERLGNIAFSSDSGWSPRCDSSPRTENAWGVLKVSAVSWGEYLPQENKALPSNLEGRPDCEVMDGDFLLSRANTAELVARSVIVDKTPPRLMMSDKIVRFQIPEEIDKFFLNLVNLSEWARDYYARNASGTSSSMKNVSRQVMCELPVPIPPLAEQHRIVAKVTQLMALIDELEAQQAKKSELAQAFAQAAVAAITCTEIKKPEKMKAPKTELVSRLQTKNTPNATDSAPLAKLLTDHNDELPAKVLWQRSGLEIDAFYEQLRTEMANGWIIEPEKAVMKEIEAD